MMSISGISVSAEWMNPQILNLFKWWIQKMIAVSLNIYIFLFINQYLQINHFVHVASPGLQYSVTMSKGPLLYLYLKWSIGIFLIMRWNMSVIIHCLIYKYMYIKPKVLNVNWLTKFLILFQQNLLIHI